MTGEDGTPFFPGLEFQVSVALTPEGEFSLGRYRVSEQEEPGILGAGRG